MRTIISFAIVLQNLSNFAVVPSTIFYVIIWCITPYTGHYNLYTIIYASNALNSVTLNTVSGNKETKQRKNDSVYYCY